MYNSDSFRLLLSNIYPPPPKPEMIWGELAKNNRGINNQNNIRTCNEGSGGKGTQVIASITPLRYADPFVGITPGSRELDY